jgi:multidrug resistance protein MdtO
LPLLREMEETVQLIPQAFAVLPSYEDFQQTGPAAAPLLKSDAFTNSAHVKFAVKGTLASMLSYVLYRGADWPGISTAIITCVLTALTTIGSSRQKQVLRIAGASVGGFIFGMGAQIFILPSVDTIFGFTILFAIVTAISAWFMTASPRLSYFGVQVALAFYLIHLQVFKFETSLTIARDRVVGVLLGLMAMWLVFDQLWGHPAGLDMRRTFLANVRLLAQLVREPGLGDRSDAVRRAYALGHQINANFDQVKSLGDGVLFEFRPSRSADIALRKRINEWQSRLRSLFLIKGALLRYRLEVPGFELPEDVEAAQNKFDVELANTLDGMADRMEGRAVPPANGLSEALHRLEQFAGAYQGSSLYHLRDFVALSQKAEQLAVSLSRDGGP